MGTARAAIVFDFDDTLTPDSTSGFLEYMGIDAAEFWENKVNPLLLDDWDPVPAYLFGMLEESRNGKPIHRSDLVNFGRTLQPYPGLAEELERLRTVARESNPLAELEYYIISSGLGEIIRNCSFAGKFRDIWASDFHYDAEGNILAPKKIISFTDKTRYLFQVNKGLIGPAARGKPYEVNKRIAPEQVRVPLQNFIYVGDGYTDIPCFSLIRQNNGVAIGVYDKHNRKKKDTAWAFVHDNRVSNLLSVDYSEDSDLCNSLEMAVKSLVGHN